MGAGEGGDALMDGGERDGISMKRDFEGRREITLADERERVREAARTEQRRENR